ncbi:MAG: DUF4921 family protein [Planctomycetaceae bacterium]|nr:DUF4921 family protein [Planctomycetaceae bacterium]
MPEYRQNPLTGQVVIVSAERGSRPHHFDIETGEVAIGTSITNCPFCEGNEHLTPGEIDSIRNSGTFADGTGWRVRVIPNKYPAACDYNGFSTYRDFRESLEFNEKLSPFDFVVKSIPAFGEHEVLVDTPRHIISVTDMTLQETIDMFRMYRIRLVSLQSSRKWAYVQIFKNVGLAAGASIPHSHSQLIAIPFVPLTVLNILEHAAKYRISKGNCFWCDLLTNEIQFESRVVEETESFLVICPFASRFASEVEIYPKFHESLLESFADEIKLNEFSDLVRRTVYRLEKAVYWIKNKLAYNFVFHIEPFEHEFGKNIFHWRLSILPSLARAAGFEWGTGLHINPIPPETAAKKLREIK